MGNLTELQWQLIILAVVNIPLYLVVGWAMFDSWRGFFKALFSSRRGNRIYTTLVNDEAPEETVAALKLFWFLVVCVGLVYCEYVIFIRGPYQPG